MIIQCSCCFDSFIITKTIICINCLSMIFLQLFRYECFSRMIRVFLFLQKSLLVIIKLMYENINSKLVLCSFADIRKKFRVSIRTNEHGFPLIRTFR